MPSRSSLNKCSEEGNPRRSGTHGARGPGPVPRNQSSTSVRTVTHRSNANPESTTSMETPPATDGRQHQDRDNTEGDGPSDPGNRKRKLNQAIVDAISSGSLSKKLKSRCVSLGGCDTSTHGVFLIITGQVWISRICIARREESSDTLGHL